MTSEKVVYLFNDNGEKKDKFRTKPADQAANPNFVVRAMAFSPDSTRLAIAQSDNIVFVYRWVARCGQLHACAADHLWHVGEHLSRGTAPSSHLHSPAHRACACRLGESWTDKKSICNKFLQTASVTCLIWPSTREDVVFGLADGKVKLGQVRPCACTCACARCQWRGKAAAAARQLRQLRAGLRYMWAHTPRVCRLSPAPARAPAPAPPQVKPGMVKSYTLYSHPEGSYVVSLCASLNGLAVVCGHLDGSIYRFTFPQARARAGPGGAVGGSPVGMPGTQHVCGAGASQAGQARQGRRAHVRARAARLHTAHPTAPHVPGMRQRHVATIMCHAARCVCVRRRRAAPA